MTETGSVERLGLTESLTAVFKTLVDMAHTRLDLLSSDLEEDRERFVSLAILGFVALFCLGVGVVLLALLLVVVFWETHRLFALGGLSGLFLAAGIAASVLVKRKAQVKPRLFTSSLSELFQDQQQLEPRR